MFERYSRDIINKRIRRDSFPSVAELALAVDLYVAHHNIARMPPIWTTQARDIPATFTRAKVALAAVVAQVPNRLVQCIGGFDRPSTAGVLCASAQTSRQMAVIVQRDRTGLQPHLTIEEPPCKQKQ